MRQHREFKRHTEKKRQKEKVEETTRENGLVVAH